MRIPREFEFDSKAVIMKKVGNTLVLEPVAVCSQRGSASALLMALVSADAGFAQARGLKLQNWIA